MSIHPTAQIDPHARLGQNVTVGAYAIIEADTVIGDGCIIDAHAFIRRYVTMGHGNEVGPYTVVGGLPQDLSFDRDAKTSVDIGNENVFREGVTVNRGTLATGSTRIGSGCFFMNNSHVAHDCSVGDHCIFATSATLGGHVQSGERVFFGGGAMVHQFCRIGAFAMVAGVIGIRKDVLPYAIVGGAPVRIYRVNTIGLRRAKISTERIRAVSAAYRLLRDDINALGGSSPALPDTPEIGHLRTWLNAASKRGIYRFAGEAEYSHGEAP